MDSSDFVVMGIFLLISIAVYTQFIKPITNTVQQRREDKRFLEVYQQRRQMIELLAKVMGKDISEVEIWSNEQLISTYNRFVDIMDMYHDNPEQFMRVASEVINENKFNEVAVDKENKITELEKEQKESQQREQISKQMIIEKLSEVLGKDVSEIEQWEDEKIINTFNTYLEIIHVQKHHPDEIEELPYSRVKDEDCPF